MSTTGISSHLGRISQIVTQLTPDSPITLCGRTLVDHDPTHQTPSNAEAWSLPACPVCADLQADTMGAKS